jgi:hypothetical protein
VALDPVYQPTEATQIARRAGRSLPDRLSDHQRLYVCGDHRETPSIQGAMNSGLRVAAKILQSSPAHSA